MGTLKALYFIAVHICLAVFASLYFHIRNRNDFLETNYRTLSTKLRDFIEKRNINGSDDMAVKRLQRLIWEKDREIKEFAELTAAQNRAITDLKALLRASQERNRGKKPRK
jgi:signal-transduction protein with cAMP-binding, CBS, and nucleotidyltransferase domain